MENFPKNEIENIDKKQPITGLGGFLNEYREKREKRNLLPVSPIKNKVSWINPDMESPFSLEEGKESDLGLFLMPKESSGALHVEVTATVEQKTRSGLIARVVFRDKEGRLYRDVDLKGIGYIKFEAGEENEKSVFIPKITEPIRSDEDQQFMGLESRGAAIQERDMSELFLKIGIRTSRVLAIIDIQEIIDKNGDKISIEKFLPEEYNKELNKPVIVVRALGTRKRLENTNSEVDVLDAIKLISQELNKKPEEFSKKDYVEWYMKTIGRQIGLMHKSGYQHGFLTANNLTLDGRIIDLDSVKKLPQDENKKDLAKKRIENDLRVAKNHLSQFLIDRLGFANNRERLLKIFEDFYDDALNKE